ncbi:MAG TPA: alpha-L-fucosidase [Bacteroidales bacterium]|nr:alpha-L-fucosidase [Bacteroidales bacterium]
MRILLYIIILISSCGSSIIPAQEPGSQDDPRMEWFGDAKLGIFIHWGIYAVNGIDESWSFYNGYISYEDYMKQLDGFTADKYFPAEWASLIKESGARYAVLTSKHHDGVALWDTRMSDLNAVDKAAAGKDLVKPFVRELRKADLKVGLYYSLLDWSHPDYPNFTKEKKRYNRDEKRQEKFTRFNHGQISELINNFNPDLYWFDGDWEQNAEWWRAEEIREMILSANPAAIINSRLQGYGDYATPEQGLPVTAPESKYWELCMTMNDSWGFQHNDRNYKTPGQIIRIFAESVSMGGNLLLDIGPMADGTIPPEQKEILRELGHWTSKHNEAIYGTNAGLPAGYYHGPSTLSADSTKLYLFVPGRPADNQVMVEGVKNKINRIYVVGDGTRLEYREYLKPYWSNHSGLIFIDLPGEVLDEHMTVLCLILDGELDTD